MKNLQKRGSCLVRVLVLVCSILILLMGCDSEKKKEVLQDLMADFKTHFISRFSNRDLIIFPPDNFREERIFTYNLKRLLLNENIKRDKKTVVFNGYLDDITKEGNQFYAHFVSPLSDGFFEDRLVRFHLKCQYEQVKPLIDNPPEYDNVTPLFVQSLLEDFIVVCLIDDVRKIKNYSVPSDEGPEDVTLKAYFLDVFSITGELIELARYPVTENPK